MNPSNEPTNNEQPSVAEQGQQVTNVPGANQPITPPDPQTVPFTAPQTTIPGLPSDSPIDPNNQAPANTSEPAAAPVPPSSPTPPMSYSNVPPAGEPQPSADLLHKAVIDDRKRSFVNGLRGFISFAIFVATVVIAAVLINQFIFQSYYVDGTSMTPTLQNNDRLIIDKTGKTLAAIENKPYVPARGSIVVLDSSIVDQYGHAEQLIKRVIGLPGETISIQDGIVTIKDTQHPEGFNVNESLGLKLAPTYVQTPMQVTIPNDSVFVMGDNRALNGSFDSRAFGPVPLDKIQGRLALRVFPFDHIRNF